MPGEALLVEFTRFVSSVEGRLVARWDAPGSCFGAKQATAAERREGVEPIQWDTARVVPLTAPFAAKYDRELRNAIRGGDLVERTRADFEAWLKVEEEREAAHMKRLEAAATEATKATAPVAEAPAEPAPALDNTPPPTEADKSEGKRKK